LDTLFKIVTISLLLLAAPKQFAQHHSKISLSVDSKSKSLFVVQELTFFNQSNQVLNKIVLNDWNNAYSTKKGALAKRFSDEFTIFFHMANEIEKGATTDLKIVDENQNSFSFSRDSINLDLIEIQLNKSLYPNEKVKLYLSYTLKLPSDRFTEFGYGALDKLTLKDFFLTPSRIEKGAFLKYNNENLEDAANAFSDYDIDFKLADNLFFQTDLKIENVETVLGFKKYFLSGKNINEINILVSNTSDFEIFKKDNIEIVSSITSNKLEPIGKAILVNKIANFVTENLGQSNVSKITISQADYDRSPFFGLNQLPSFLSPFTNEFLFEIKFLKTYVYKYLKANLHLNTRKESWIYDGIQTYLMMQYMDQFHPDSKMMGSLARFKILKSFNLVNLDFNDQYSYFYTLMSRANNDQPLSSSKEILLKFNEQIANKYRAGLSLKYLDAYLQKNIVQNSIKEFYSKNLNQTTNKTEFENILKTNAEKNIDWFFNTIVNSRDLVDFKITNYTKTNDSITFNLKNKTLTNVPIPVYGLQNNIIVFKKWYGNVANDTIITIPKNNIERLVVNYENEVPEFNLRNNYTKTEGFWPNNRPLKFVFMKDLEDPKFNQVLYVPTLTYNLYDGASPGFRFHNRTILQKPFIFDMNPAYAPNTKTLIGLYSVGINQNFRDSKLFNIFYSVSGSFSHYAPNAAYSKFNSGIYLNFREKELRNNHREQLFMRYIFVNRENLLQNIVLNKDLIENYSVLNLRYTNIKTEMTKQIKFVTDFQASETFGKLVTEFQFRKLFDNKRQLNLRFYSGTFLYNNYKNDFFSFALDRPTDYMFDYDYIGRSEDSGIFSQQYIAAEGAFKSKIATPFANQWIATINASFNIWNWIEVYGDVGLIKSRLQNTKFAYDNGIRLNLVTDYFELYFPVYSNNGWEISQSKYAEKIRFIVAFDPRALLGLFTRKYF
jgi:hypothetical protein